MELFKGVVKFKEETYPKYASLFKDLADQQHPKTLFIACSDSRVDPNLITSSLPGDLFNLRNVGNVMPPSYLANTYVSAPAAMEFSVKELGVKNIVVCGHSNCGACIATTVPPNTLSGLPLTSHWINFIRPATQLAMESPSDEKLTTKVEQYNVLVQISNLHTYPWIYERVVSKRLAIYGWYYDIGNGNIYNYEYDKQQFTLID